MRVWLVGLVSAPAACVAPTGQAPWIAHRAPDACAIHDTHLEARTVRLHQRGEAFANLAEPIDRLDVEMAGEVARARVETDTVVLEGDLALDAVDVRPIEPIVHDGWLDVRGARPMRASGDVMALYVEPPNGVVPMSTTIYMRCSALTFRPPPSLPDAEDSVMFHPYKRTPLRIAPGGAVVANVISAASVTAAVLEHGPLWTKVRIGLHDTNRAQGWVPTSAVTAVHGEGKVARVDGVEDDPAEHMTCNDDVALLVDGVPVGHLKAHARARVSTRDHLGTYLDLGAPFHPFAPAAAVAGCTYD